MLRIAGSRPPARAIRAGLARGLPAAVADRIVAAVPVAPAHPAPLGYVFCGRPGATGLDPAVRDGLRARGWPVEQRRYLGAAGEFGTVSPLLQLAGLLTEFGGGLVVAADPLGPVAAVYVTPAPDRPAQP